MIEKITARLKELGVAIELKSGRDMIEVVGAKWQADHREMASLIILAIFSLVDALLIFIVRVEDWVAVIISGVILVVYFAVETHFNRHRTLLKILRKKIELEIGNRIAVALAVVQIEGMFVLLIRVARKDPEHGVYDFEFRLLGLQAVLLVLQDLFTKETAASRFVVVYLLAMQAASLEAFQDGPAGLLTEEMANALGAKPVAVSFL